MNFSKYKLQNYLSEDVTAETNSEMASEKSTNSAAAKNDRRATKMAGKQQNFSQSQGTAMKNKMQYSSFDAESLRKEKEAIKMMENQKSDWRKDLQEKVVDGQERENHPYVTVMPTGDENLIQAMKQMGKEVKGKKDEMKGQVKEDVENLEEKKKECKKGYKRDEDGNCVKKKSSSKTTVIMGRGYGYGGHHHHDDDDDDNGGGGDDVGGGGDGGGGMGEMFDVLGDMLLQEKELSLWAAQKAGKTKGDPKTPIDHAKLNRERVDKAVLPKTSDKDRAK